MSDGFGWGNEAWFWFDVAVTNPWDDEFQPSAGARSTLRWAHEMRASTLAEAYDLLDQPEISNDVPEFGIELVGPDAPLPRPCLRSADHAGLDGHQRPGT
ncbi:MAG TPA: hypothetical protein VHN80_07500, partial [Kineosporiaceae bacterium]|nr:hypothetical protein [Kineosporiaceae bacterium]